MPARCKGFPGGSDDKESASNEGDSSIVLKWGKKSLEKERTTHSSILAWRIPDRGVWLATVHGFTKSPWGRKDTTARLTFSLW